MECEFCDEAASCGICIPLGNGSVSDTINGKPAHEWLKEHRCTGRTCRKNFLIDTQEPEPELCRRCIFHAYGWHV